MQHDARATDWVKLREEVFEVFTLILRSMKDDIISEEVFDKFYIKRQSFSRHLDLPPSGQSPLSAQASDRSARPAAGSASFRCLSILPVLHPIHNLPGSDVANELPNWTGSRGRGMRFDCHLRPPFRADLGVRFRDGLRSLLKHTKAPGRCNFIIMALDRYGSLVARRYHDPITAAARHYGVCVHALSMARERRRSMRNGLD